MIATISICFPLLAAVAALGWLLDCAEVRPVGSDLTAICRNGLNQDFYCPPKRVIVAKLFRILARIFCSTVVVCPVAAIAENVSCSYCVPFSVLNHFVSFVFALLMWLL
jgi:hypothetical protein